MSRWPEAFTLFDKHAPRELTRRWGIMAEPMSARVAVSLLSLLTLACTAKPPESDAPTSSAQPVDGEREGEPANQSEIEQNDELPEPESETGDQIGPASDSDAKLQRGTIELSQFRTTLTVEKGAELHYSFNSHGSVGYGADYSIASPTIVRYVRTDMDYAHPEKMKAGMSGADEATGTFVFEARAVGSTTLRVTEDFRGEIELEVEYSITVVDP